MAQKSHKVQRAAIELALDRVLKYIYKDPYPNLVKMADRVGKLFSGIFPPENFKKFKEAAADPATLWTKYALGILRDEDPRVVKQMLMSLGVDAGLYGTKPCAGCVRKCTATCRLSFFSTRQAPAT